MKKLFSAALAVMMILALAACSHSVPPNYVHSVEDMNGKTVGVLNVSESAGYMDRFAGSVTVRRYETVKSMTAGLESGEVDCVLADAGTARRMTRQSGSVTRLDEPYADCDYRLAVSVDNKEMLDKLNSALRRAESSGAMDWARENYASDDKTLHVTDPDKDTVTVGVEPGFYPYAFYDENGVLSGIEIDTAYAVCDELGLEPEFLTAEPDMLLYLAESGKCAFAIGRLARDTGNQAVAYTSGYTHSTQYVVVRKG